MNETLNQTHNSTTKISCQNVWKVFGPDPKNAIDVAGKGSTKQQILEETGNVVAVKDISFDIKENEIFVIMGLSGSGKSTLVRCINRLIDPTSGLILIDGEDISQVNRTQLRDIRRHKMSMVFQHFGLLPHRSVVDNISFGLEIAGVGKRERREKAIEALELVGLKGWEHSQLTELSGGMQQRVGLARALAVDCEILLMDEAFSALDPLIRRQMQDEFLNLRDVVKKTTVFITHDLIEALKMGDRIAIMRDGEIVQLGTPEEIVGQPADEYVSEFVKDVPRGKVITAQTIMEPAVVEIYPERDIETVMGWMRDWGTRMAYIIDRTGRLQGTVHIKQAISGLRDGHATVREIMDREFVTIPGDMPLADVLNIVAENPNSIAVVDDFGHFLGVITRMMVIQALNPDGSDNV